jgi:hypothetical protein
MNNIESVFLLGHPTQRDFFEHLRGSLDECTRLYSTDRPNEAFQRLRDIEHALAEVEARGVSTEFLPVLERVKHELHNDIPYECELFLLITSQTAFIF